MNWWRHKVKYFLWLMSCPNYFKMRDLGMSDENYGIAYERWRADEPIQASPPSARARSRPPANPPTDRT